MKQAGIVPVKVEQVVEDFAAPQVIRLMVAAKTIGRENVRPQCRNARTEEAQFKTPGFTDCLVFATVT